MTSDIASSPARAIAVRGVGKTFARSAVVLDDISFEVAPGEFIAVVGPSGCGKSTLLRLLAGLDSPSKGAIEMAADDASNRTAFVFQEPALLPWRSVTANIALALELNGIAKKERIQRVRECLSLVGLSRADASKRPRQLSGGMRMRVSLARSLVTRPGLMLLDEPFAALDDLLRQQLNDELHRLWLEQRWTAVFVTHNIAEAAFLANRVLLMSAQPGHVTADVTVPFSCPREPRLRDTAEFAKFVGGVNDLLRTANAAP
jgi:NitT/TauT family transport system ATP-binding protein